MDLTLKKSLGQHFLHDESVLQRIAAAVLTVPHNRILEVGPGGGALTKYLLEIEDADFKAVELDDEKVPYLHQLFPQLGDRLIHQNFLQMQPPFEEPFAVVGNFPYNISTEIVFRCIAWRAQVTGMVGMFQKEVAQRIAAPPGSKVYGVTSVLTQAFFEVDYLFDVPPEAFNPPPKVVSGVLRMAPRKEALDIPDEKRFFTVVKAAFGQRRKTLRNAMSSVLSKHQMEGELFNKRAEQLSVSDFLQLAALPGGDGPVP